MHCLVLCKASARFIEELMKMNVEYVECIPGKLDKYFERNKRYLIKLDDLMDEASKGS